MRDLNEQGPIIEKLEETIVSLQDQLNRLALELKGIRAEEQEKKKESAIT
jgi:hypothetical protein